MRAVERYYSAKITRQGARPAGVDWNSSQSQQARFEQLLKLVDSKRGFSLNDYGCGYGALVQFLLKRKISFRYNGFDISKAMIAHAQRETTRDKHITFFCEPSGLRPADYTVASGIFNVKLDAPAAAWTKYVLDTLNGMAKISRRGFGFNMLTSYSDRDRMRPDLYYGDPGFYFDYCLRKFSRHVALLHDYGLYEFTLLVRLAEDG